MSVDRGGFGKRVHLHNDPPGRVLAIVCQGRQAHACNRKQPASGLSDERWPDRLAGCVLLQQHRHAGPLSGEAPELLGLDIGAARNECFFVGWKEEIVAEQRGAFRFHVGVCRAQTIKHLDEVRRVGGQQPPEPCIVEKLGVVPELAGLQRRVAVVQRRNGVAVRVCVLAARSYGRFSHTSGVLPARQIEEPLGTRVVDQIAGEAQVSRSRAVRGIDLGLRDERHATP